MEINLTKERISIRKELNQLDRLAIDFTSVLDKHKVKYVIVSGYVAILFGRNRASEDIDIIVEKFSLQKWNMIWKDLSKRFECINALTADTSYREYLVTQHAIRFSRPNEFVPNVELKFVKHALDTWGLKERKEVLLNNTAFFISPLELEIPFKLFLGSEKDIEDARFLYRLFKARLDAKLLHEFNRKLKIESLFNQYLQK